MKFDSTVKVLCKRHQNATLLNKVFIFSAILLHSAKFFCKLEIFFEYVVHEYTITNMKV